MDGDQWVLVLVRAWWDDGRFRARLLTTDSAGQSTSTHLGTPDDVAQGIRRLLAAPPDVPPDAPENLPDRDR